MPSDNASVALLSGHYVLLVILKSGEYSLPGGGRNPGEKDWDAMSREWREETGMRRPTRDQADLSNKYKWEYRYRTSHGTIKTSITKIYYGQTRRPFTWYSFNRDGCLSTGETSDLLWMKVSDAIKDPRVKSYCRKSLKEMKDRGCFR